MPGSPAHLIRRFFDVATARPLTIDESNDVESWLDGNLQELFFAQEPADQRHGYHAARSVISAGFDHADVREAALLHDIGKRHANLGVVGRSLASLLILARLPLNRHMKIYRDHGDVGSAELAEAGASRLTVDFTRLHHGPRPSSIDTEIWEVLIAADQPPKTRRVRTGRITSGD